MTARALRPDTLVLTGEVMRVLQKEGLICAEVSVGADGKGFIRFAPDAELVEVDYGGCSAVGVGGYHSESYGEDGGKCDWCGLVRKQTEA